MSENDRNCVRWASTPTVIPMSPRWWMPPVGSLARRRFGPTPPVMNNWLGSWGRVAQVGIEGTGSYGAGLSRHLTGIGVEVAE